MIKVKIFLDKILSNHIHFLQRDCEHWETMRANLNDTDLYNADLHGVNLREADLSDADLRWANLQKACLCDTNLQGADLFNANLSNADLRGADLRYVDLRGADLTNADLTNADLTNADLRDAYLIFAKNIPYIPYTCPDHGSFIGFKKANGKIVELEILEDSKRLSSTARQCRCDKAKVLGIYDHDHNKLNTDSVPSDYDENFIYKVGEIVSVDNFDEGRWKECTTGIHFFINFQEAVNY